MLRGTTIIGVSIQYDLLEYLRMPSMPSSLELFRVLGETGRILDTKVDYQGFKNGEVSYGLYGVIDPSEAGNRHAMKFWWYQFAAGKVGGWKYYYSRLSSEVSLKLLLRLGAEVIAETDVIGLEGKHKMWMIRIDLRGPLLSYSQMAKLMSKPKPKL